MFVLKRMNQMLSGFFFIVVWLALLFWTVMMMQSIRHDIVCDKLNLREDKRSYNSPVVLDNKA